MGVFTEAYKQCPFCGQTGVAQISEQWGLHLDLDDVEELAETYRSDQLERLFREVSEEQFLCERSPTDKANHFGDEAGPYGCGRSFTLEEARRGQTKGRSTAGRLFGPL